MHIDIDCHPTGPLDVEVCPYEHTHSLGKASLTIGNYPLLGNRVRIHGLTPSQLHQIALAIAKGAQQLAAMNEHRQAKEPPQDVPFPVTDLQDALKETPEEFADGFRVQEKIVHGRPCDVGNPVA